MPESTPTSRIALGIKWTRFQQYGPKDTAATARAENEIQALRASDSTASQALGQLIPLRHASILNPAFFEIAKHSLSREVALRAC
jgi:hypothetical protein